MNSVELVQFLLKHDVELWTDSVQLFYRGTNTVLTSAILHQIREHKTGILQHLKENRLFCKSYPLSHAQKSLWYIYQSAPSSSAYNTAMAVRLKFKVDEEKLKYTYQVLIARHPLLRTVFYENDNSEYHEPYQKVLAFQKIHFEKIDASTWSSEKLKAIVKQNHQRPFDLENGPVIRASLFTIKEDDHILLTSIHHIVCDGWSMWMLMDEQWKIYSINDNALSSHLPLSSNSNGHLKYPEKAPSVIDWFDEQFDPSFTAFNNDANLASNITDVEAADEFNSYIQRSLLHIFQRSGIFLDSSEAYPIDQLKAKLNIIPRYFKLFEAIIGILADAQFIKISDNIITSHNSDLKVLSEINHNSHDFIVDQKKHLIANYPFLESYLDLLEASLQNFIKLLSGKRHYMEILFPHGSLRLVENIYKNNTIADYYNQTVARLVRTAIQKIVAHDPSKRVKIIEVGAGTGGTSLCVLKAIKNSSTLHNVEYIYTDISPVFLQHGINNYQNNFDFTKFKVFDISKNPEDQDFESDSVHIIIASNVIHATSSIENSLLNLKKLLITNGLLIINEITEIQSFLTLTFGLTDNWWQYEDKEDRIEGSPLMRQEQWKHLLEKCGFRKICFPGKGETSADFPSISGQTIIAAESNGLNKISQLKPKPSDTSLEKITHSYQDYVKWQSEMLISTEGIQLFNYWKKQLAGEPPVLNLPLDQPRPSHQTFSGDWISFELNQQLSNKLKKLARNNSVTLYSLLLSTYFIFLHRYTGQSDITVGCPTSGRPHTSFNGIVGDFVNTVPVRADCSGNPEVIEFIGRINRTLLDAIDHQQLPFSLLVERLNPQRTSNISPIFQTMFVFQKPQNFSDSIDTITDFYAGKGKMSIHGYEFESFPIPQQTGQFDLSIEMTGSEDFLKGVLKYNCDLFKIDTMKSMIKNFISLLHCVVEQPFAHISESDFIDKEDMHKMLFQWNDTKAIWNFQCIHNLFEHQVKLTPDANALAFKDQQLSYKDLNYRANQVANYLIKQGVRPDDTVGICIEPSFEMIIGIIAILKAGGAYVPLDRTYPTERLAFMIENSKISFLLAIGNFKKFDHFSNVHLIRIDRDWDLINEETGLESDIELSTDNLAYILYTSGSTGMPKGVAMPHRPLCNLIYWQKRNSNISQNSKTLQFTTLNFDVSFQEIFTTLCSGGTLMLIPNSLRQDPISLLKFLRNEAVDRLFVPFVFLQALAEAAETDVNLIPENLREIITAGEQLRITPSIKSFFNQLNHCSLCNQYGPTETHVVTSFTLSKNPNTWPYLPPIGKPIANTQIYILDKNLNPVPQGVLGEIFIGGICLAKGYFQQPELTHKKFIQSISKINQKRLYRTGDIARFLSDGTIEFYGRTDHQIKIRGFRIEPYEIEKQLEEHISVSKAVVADFEDKNGIKSLIAYFVCNKELSPMEIKKYLIEKLPSYMIPSYFIKLDHIPLLPNNKVDRLSLPRPNQYVSKDIDYIAPRNDTEKAIVDFCRELTSVPQIGIDTNFFDMGINSLTTLTLHRKIDKRYPGKIKIPDLLQYPTVSDLATLIQSRKSVLPQTSEKETQYHTFLETINSVQ